ncbi:MAG: Unknown protein [uncultured Sulfurovum sp.]|uniref:DUF481 domain-containing protein n=1 Tax=uncultured Sulfurovum sp. TaxID=269237 RepID=A0A6S6UIP7_9BACT|nr:MAG: Unknown protein [uncultured Sulfurovum sp.]
MKVVYIGISIILMMSHVSAEMEEHHDHVGFTKIELNYENLNFKNSKKKYDAKRHGVKLDFQNDKQHMQVYVEHTDTNTKPIVPKDLLVNKYSFKYEYVLDKKNIFMLSYIRISDNIMDEVNDGDIYGFGYKYKVLDLKQYISNYNHFKVYQSDIKLGMKKRFYDFNMMGAVVGKYIHLHHKNSNPFSRKAKSDYFTLGLKSHIDYGKWHLSMGTYIGERAFSVMNQGMKVQHHAMEFDKSMMFGISRDFDKFLLQARYVKHYAIEIPLENKNVELDVFSILLHYTF